MNHALGEEQKYENSLVTVANGAALVASCVTQLDVNKNRSRDSVAEMTLDNARSMAVARFKTALKIPAPALN